MTGHLRKETDEVEGGIISRRLCSPKKLKHLKKIEKISSQKIEAGDVKTVAQLLQSRRIIVKLENNAK